MATSSSRKDERATPHHLDHPHRASPALEPGLADDRGPSDLLRLYLLTLFDIFRATTTMGKGGRKASVAKGYKLAALSTEELEKWANAYGVKSEGKERCSSSLMSNSI